MEETISLKELFQTLRKRLNLIIVIALLAVIVSGVISYFFITPIYKASTQILVNQTKSEQSLYTQSEVQTNLQLINTYNVIMKSPAVLDVVVEELNLDMGTAALNQKITVQSENNSQVVTMSVEDEDPGKAAEIANKTAEVFKNKVQEFMNVDNVNIIAVAAVAENQTPIKPQPLLNIAIALVVGLMAGVGLAFLLEYLDNTVKTEQDIEKMLELPVLGVITKIDEEDVPAPRGNRTSRVRGESIGS
ncbi:capsular biosynthesis protein [Bacillus infantis]|uniref:Capsular biosynthesis protein n=1 Tax=Bacillus infantis TaxID=324767 RepID=A0A5D4SQ75_9BACI|nr:Wzz/FepE/Etk N-terminal domain-containing protein [Bacillus infantis]TYS63966.1 capsular biosynthesis protein [Bacillus infantis]